MGRYDVLRQRELLPLAQAQPKSAPVADQLTPQPKPPSVNEPTHRPTRARTDGSSQEIVEHLRKKFRAKQRLASYTFRFQPEDLEELNRVFESLQDDYQG